MLKQILLILSIIAISSEACVPWDPPDGLGRLNACVSTFNCAVYISVRRFCINFDSIVVEIRSGHSMSIDYHCRVFSQANCMGTAFPVSFTMTQFPFVARSFDCPWRC